MNSPSLEAFDNQLKQMSVKGPALEGKLSQAGAFWPYDLQQTAGA